MKYGGRAGVHDTFRPNRAGVERASRGRVLLLLSCIEILLAIGADRSSAVVLSGGDASQNTIAPADDPGWDNVGVHGGGTAVYLGNRWVITANHLRLVDTISFRGIDMVVEQGTETTLANPPDERLTPQSDLRLVRLEQDPGLPSLTVSAQPPPPGSEVLMIGRGRDRQDELTRWTVSPADDSVLWTETASSTFDRSGYKWGSTQTMRWGTNVVVSDEIRRNGGTTMNDDSSSRDLVKVETLATRFDQFGGTEFESHATRGDSGGGVFFKNDAQWELAGILVSVDGEEGQPENAAVFGNFTEFADLSVYHDEIADVVAPRRPRAGDANRDYSFDQFDLVQVLRAGKYLTGQPVTWGEGDWNATSTSSTEFPPPGDGVFDQFDIVAALQTGLYQTGPYGADQSPALTDMIALDASLTGFRDDSPPILGPPPGMDCLAPHNRRYSMSAAADSVLINHAHVPEPGGFILLAVGCAILATYRRRQTSP